MAEPLLPAPRRRSKPDGLLNPPEAALATVTLLTFAHPVAWISMPKPPAPSMRSWSSARLVTTREKLTSTAE